MRYGVAVSTLSDVAERVGVSEATVSRVLNGKPGVSEATRQVVLAALDTMGYDRPTRLRGSKGRMVGLVVPDITNPIFASMSASIGARLAAEGFAVMLCTVDPGGLSASESEYLELLLQHQVSGVILSGGAFHGVDAPLDMYQPLVDRKIPTVLINSMPGVLPFATVTCDDTDASRLAWRHLRSLGHERIGMVVGTRHHLPSRRKKEALFQLAAADGLPYGEHLVRYTDYTVESAQMATTDLVTSEDVTAVVCTSDLEALGAIRAGERLGLSVPDDLSVVGYDDSYLMAHTSPPLTTVRQPVTAMGSATVRLLLDEIEGRRNTSRDFLFDPELVVRGSTGAARPKARE